jgi:hypothetical protein
MTEVCIRARVVESGHFQNVAAMKFVMSVVGKMMDRMTMMRMRFGVGQMADLV